MNKQIYELLTRIKTGLLKGKRTVVTPFSIKNAKLLWNLKKQGFIRGFEIIAPNRQKKCLLILLKYDETQCSAISELKVVSRIEKRLTFRKPQTKYNKTNFNTYFFSTQNGIHPSLAGECVFIIK